jgi:hypothetical protein
LPKDDIKLNLRLPPAIHSKMTELKTEHRRSLNDEIIVACEKWIAEHLRKGWRATKPTTEEGNEP